MATQIISKTHSVLLLGQPNGGKSSLFNQLTHSHSKSTNFPGVTVEVKRGVCQVISSTAASHPILEIIDLPGLYSLAARGQDEKIAKQFLMQHLKDQPGEILLLADATKLSKSLYLAQELRHLGIPFTLVLTLSDLAQRRGLELDLAQWKERWGCEIFLINTLDRKSLIPLVDFLQQRARRATETENETETEERPLALQWESFEQLGKSAQVKLLFQQVDQLLSKVTLQGIKPDGITAQLDRWLLHPFWGHLALALMILMMFQVLFTVAAPFQDGISASFDTLADWVMRTWGPSTGRDFVTSGLITGLGSVLVFLPQIILLNLLIGLLEDSGYLARAAALLDGMMRRLGLPGKAVIPLLSSHSCAIAGIQAARTLDREQDRLVAILIAPLMTCSARLPVYTLLVSALIPNYWYWGPIQAQALAMFGLYSIGVLGALLSAWLIKILLLRDFSGGQLFLDLPPYRWPLWKNAYRLIKSRSLIFVRKAGTIILGLSLLLWGLSYFPKGAPADQSYAAQLGKAATPVFAPFKFDWQLTAALIPSFAAREVMVSALATVKAVQLQQQENEAGSEPQNEEEEIGQLAERLHFDYSLATIVALLAWFVFAPQCISTFAMIRKEVNSAGWALGAFFYSLVVAYVFALVCYYLTSYIFGP